MRRVTAAAVRLVMHPLWRLTRGQTFGVRAMVIDQAGAVLLVEHSYAPGWHLPGGGVERGESAREAVGRELAEEAAVNPTAPPVLFGLYANEAQMRGDHVALYVVREWQAIDAPRRRLEIRRTGFFAPDRLPDGTSAGTRRRIEEVFGGNAPAEAW